MATTLVSLMALACVSITRPCTEGGESNWRKKFGGDLHCTQKKNAQGVFVNDGEYRALHSDGTVALKGQFVMGKKEGIWAEYNEKGEKVLEKYFERGVEMAVPDSVRDTKK